MSQHTSREVKSQRRREEGSHREEFVELPGSWRKVHPDVKSTTSNHTESAKSKRPGRAKTRGSLAALLFFRKARGVALLMQSPFPGRER